MYVTSCMCEIKADDFEGDMHESLQMMKKDFYEG